MSAKYRLAVTVKLIDTETGKDALDERGDLRIYDIHMTGHIGLRQAGELRNAVTKALFLERLRTRAQWFDCGDECQCRCPEIRRFDPLANRGRGEWQLVEDGPFHSDPDPDNARRQWAWLLAAAVRYDVDNLEEIKAEYAKHYPPVDGEKT